MGIQKTPHARQYTARFSLSLIIKKVCLGVLFCLFLLQLLDAAGRIWTFGCGKRSQLGVSPLAAVTDHLPHIRPSAQFFVPTLVNVASSAPIVAVGCGDAFTVTVDASGDVRFWGTVAPRRGNNACTAPRHMGRVVLPAQGPVLLACGESFFAVACSSNSGAAGDGDGCGGNDARCGINNAGGGGGGGSSGSGGGGGGDEGSQRLLGAGIMYEENFEADAESEWDLGRKLTPLPPFPDEVDDDEDADTDENGDVAVEATGKAGGKAVAKEAEGAGNNGNIESRTAPRGGADGSCGGGGGAVWSARQESKARGGRALVSLAAGHSHLVALLADGSAFGLGARGKGQLGLGEAAARTPGLQQAWEAPPRERRRRMGRVDAVACGAFHTLWLCRSPQSSQSSAHQGGSAQGSGCSGGSGGSGGEGVDGGAVWASGLNDEGQLGLGSFGGGAENEAAGTIARAKPMVPLPARVPGLLSTLPPPSSDSGRYGGGSTSTSGGGSGGGDCGIDGGGVVAIAAGGASSIAILAPQRLASVPSCRRAAKAKAEAVGAGGDEAAAGGGRARGRSGAGAVPGAALCRACGGCGGAYMWGRVPASSHRPPSLASPLRLNALSDACACACASASACACASASVSAGTVTTTIDTGAAAGASASAPSRPRGGGVLCLGSVALGGAGQVVILARAPAAGDLRKGPPGG